MKRDAIEAITTLERRARPVIEAPDFHISGRYYVRHANGDMVTEFARRPFAPAVVYSTEDLAALAKHRAEAGHAEKPYAAFVGYERIALAYGDPELPDTSQVADRITLALHPVYAELEAISGGADFTQRQLITWLRATMNGAVAEETIQLFRSLSLSTTGEGASQIARAGREAVSRKATQRIAADAGADIPDAILVTTPVYDLLELRAHNGGVPGEVLVLVDASADEDGKITFRLTPVLDTLRAAMEEANGALYDNLGDHLTNAGVHIPIFRGEP